MSEGQRQPWQPSVRLRSNCKYTAKDGWRADETTAEVTIHDGDLYGADLLLRDAQRVAFDAANDEANRRNREDGRGN